MKNFIIFYDDGTEITANAESLDIVKPFGVICIAQERSDGNNHILSEKDYYAFVNEHWIVLDQIGLVDYMTNKLGSIKKLVVGRTIDNQSYYDITDRARKKCLKRYL